MNETPSQNPGKKERNIKTPFNQNKGKRKIFKKSRRKIKIKIKYSDYEGILQSKKGNERTKSKRKKITIEVRAQKHGQECRPHILTNMKSIPTLQQILLPVHQLFDQKASQQLHP